ncbi:MAG: crossover junction endodeoxyribonuclease RuvC [Planctomycetes bacterium]|nr:crossover junction endodeoxyribonuclease RuvC [Planctomycetota bacterium]
MVGYGAIVARESGPRLFGAGVLRPPPKLAVPERLGAILREFETLLAEVRPDVVVVEQAFASRNVQSALRIGEGRGVILAAAARFGSAIVQFPPAVAKKALVGNGAADKTQVAAMVAAALGLTEVPEPLDATDALALALAHVLRAPARALPRLG